MKSNLLRIVNTYEYEYGLKLDGAWTQFSSLEEAILTTRSYFKDWVASALLNQQKSLPKGGFFKTLRKIFQDFHGVSRKNPDTALFSLHNLTMERFSEIVILFNKTRLCSN